MGWYRRSKVGVDAFRSFASKFSFSNSIQRTNHGNSLVPNALGKPSPSGSSRILRNSCFQYGIKQNQYSGAFFGGARRYYYVDRHQIQHFRPRGPHRWFQNPRIVLIVVLVGSGLVITVYMGNLETIPYTKRTHFVLLSKDIEKRLGESQFQEMKKSFKGKILPAIHPESVRVRLIATEIIEALQRGLRKEQVWTDLHYASDAVEPHETSGHETLMALSNSNPEANWSKDDEILDDSWVQKSRKKGQEKGSESATGHIEGLQWEVLVVNDPVVNAFCLPGGKIVVFTGLLEHFRTDAEIATIIGHEVCIKLCHFIR